MADDFAGELDEDDLFAHDEDEEEIEDEEEVEYDEIETFDELGIFEAIRKDDHAKIRDILPKINIQKTYKVDDDDESAEGHTILSYMIYLNKYDMFDEFIDIIDPNRSSDELKYVLLWEYMEVGDTYQTLFALKHTQNIDYHEGRGTALHMAIRRSSRNKDDLIIVEKLLERGANLNIKNHCNYTASDLMIRYQFNHLEQFKQYDIKYANIIFLDYAIHNFNSRYNGFSYDDIENILNHVKDVNEIIMDGHTVLWYAMHINNKSLDIIELLKESGAHE